MILLYALLGGFCGLLAGFMLIQIVRYVSFLMGRNIGSYGWVVVSSLAGAILFAWMAAAINTTDN